MRVPVGHILCNEKWRESELVKQLKGGVRVLFDDHVGVADFRPSDNIVVVYLTEADLVAGASYRQRLVKLRMVENTKGVVLAERTATTDQYWTALQHFVVLDLGMVVVPVVTSSEAAQFLIQMVHIENRPSGNTLRMRPKEHRAKETGLLVTLQTVPGLGDTKAKALLNHFKNLQAICNATENELAAVVGQSTAAHIRQFFSARHDITR